MLVSLGVRVVLFFEGEELKRRTGKKPASFCGLRCEQAENSLREERPYNSAIKDVTSEEDAANRLKRDLEVLC